MIDHHKPEEEPINTLIYRDPSSISTCSLLYEITKDWWIDLYDSDIATYFYMGLSTDS
jgi:nanoRNase/pAp phosphatase (c-di-AMP/oligoRNAs hydrolase)